MGSEEDVVVGLIERLHEYGGISPSAAGKPLAVHIDRRVLRAARAVVGSEIALVAVGDGKTHLGDLCPTMPRPRGRTAWQKSLCLRSVEIGSVTQQDSAELQ